MDLSDINTRLHPAAKEFLFQYYNTLRKIFYKALGHLEMEYMAIALLNPQGEWLFFSSRPSIEYNLIEKKLWQFDAIYQEDFLIKNKPQFWHEFYTTKGCNLLHYYKQLKPEISLGISLPSLFKTYRVVYSFGLHTHTAFTQNKLIHNTEALIRMGQFCLQQIMRAIPLPKTVNYLASSASIFEPNQ